MEDSKRTDPINKEELAELVDAFSKFDTVPDEIKQEYLDTLNSMIPPEYVPLFDPLKTALKVIGWVPGMVQTAVYSPFLEKGDLERGLKGDPVGAAELMQRRGILNESPLQRSVIGFGLDVVAGGLGGGLAGRLAKRLGKSLPGAAAGAAATALNPLAKPAKSVGQSIYDVPFASRNAPAYAAGGEAIPMSKTLWDSGFKGNMNQADREIKKIAENAQEEALKLVHRNAKVPTDSTQILANIENELRDKIPSIGGGESAKKALEEFQGVAFPVKSPAMGTLQGAHEGASNLQRAASSQNAYRSVPKDVILTAEEALKNKIAGSAYAKGAKDLRQEVRDKLNAIQPGSGEQYNKANKTYQGYKSSVGVAKQQAANVAEAKSLPWAVKATTPATYIGRAIGGDIGSQLTGSALSAGARYGSNQLVLPTDIEVLLQQLADERAKRGESQ